MPEVVEPTPGSEDTAGPYGVLRTAPMQHGTLQQGAAHHLSGPTLNGPTLAAQNLAAQHLAAQHLAAQHLAEQHGALRAEIAELGEVIARASAELGALEAHGVRGRHIPAATDELDAIVAHTAAATDAILEACEALDDTARAMDPARAGAVQAATARIYEACSFQDIVGQRTSKVVATLRMIDSKVAHLKGMLTERATLVAMPEDPELSYEAGVLLNGPQLVAAAMAQSEVDRLLSGAG